MRVRFVSFVAVSLMLTSSAWAETGGAIIDGRMRDWLTSETESSAADAHAFCKSQGLELASAAEGLAVLAASQTADGNELLGESTSQSFWTSDRGFSIDAITIIPMMIIIPYPGYFHQVVKVYKYQQMADAQYYDVVNQPFLWGFRHRALCISN